MMHDHASLRRHAQHHHGERIKGNLREHGGRPDEAQDKASSSARWASTIPSFIRVNIRN